MITNLIFGSKEYASAYARAREKTIGDQVCSELYTRLETILGRMRMYTDGPAGIGAAMFQSVIKGRNIPDLIDLHQLAHTLHMHLVVELVRLGYLGTTHSVTFDMDRKSVQPTIIHMMEYSYSHRIPGFSLALLREQQQMYLLRVREESMAVTWLSLIDYFAASGYELNVYLKEATNASAVKLPVRRKRCGRAKRQSLSKSN